MEEDHDCRSGGHCAGRSGVWRCASSMCAEGLGLFEKELVVVYSSGLTRSVYGVVLGIGALGLSMPGQQGVYFSRKCCRGGYLQALLLSSRSRAGQTITLPDQLIGN